MDNPIRVLHVFGGLSLGGAESRIMDLYRCIDRDRIQFDFLVHQEDAAVCEGDQVRKPEFFDEEIRNLGGRVYILPKFKVYNYLAYRKAVKKFFQMHHDYRVVQGHMTSTAAIYLPEAKKAGIPVVAAHARSAGVDKGIKGMVTRFLRLPLLRIADYCFACSKEAGESVFGRKWGESEKAVILPNAIDAGKFVFVPEKREKLKEELKIADSFVVGHVGRFHYAKNHEFLVEIFADLRNKMKKQGKRAVLMLLGEGSGMEEIRHKAEELGIKEDVLFMGNKKDVWNYYQVFDYFVFPSRFEGLPGTVVEAQAAGLKCMISDRITPEVAFSRLVCFKSIEENAAIWADDILDNASYERKPMCSVVERAGFDVRGQAEILERFYKTGKMS